MFLSFSLAVFLQAMGWEPLTHILTSYESV